MTTEEAIDYLERCADGLDPEFDNAVSLAIAALRAQQEAEKKWISVKDKLPDLIPCGAGTAYSEAVIVLTSGRKAMIAIYDGTDFLCAADYWDAEGETITHWMPLPELPKEGAI